MKTLLISLVLVIVVFGLFLGVLFAFSKDFRDLVGLAYVHYLASEMQSTVVDVSHLKNSDPACSSYFFNDYQITFTDEQLQNFEKKPECFHWTAFYVAANTLFDAQERLDDGLFYLYVGQLRAYVGTGIDVQGLENDPQNTELRAAIQRNVFYNYNIAEKIQRYGRSDKEKFLSIRKKARNWDIEYPYTQDIHGSSYRVSDAEWQEKYNEGRDIDLKYIQETEGLDFEYERIRSYLTFALLTGEIESKTAGGSYNYEDLCSNKKVTENLELAAKANGEHGAYTCNDSESKYAISIPIGEEHYYCIDSMALSKKTWSPLGSAVSCD